jgi:biopolymer transport protein ExbD
MIRNRDHHAGDTHVDFVPMVDVLFNLLIFFLIATTMAQVERETRVALPASRAAGPITAALRELIINVDAQGVIYVAGRVVSDEQLGVMLRESVAAGTPKVSIRGDRSAAYAHIARVLDLCKAAGVGDPFLESVEGR